MTFLLLVFLSLATVHAQTESSPPQLDFPVIDAPFTFAKDAYTFPSMRQSISLSTNFYQAGHQLILGDRPRTFGRVFALAAFDFFSGWIPFGNSWLHEEWHRAVMLNRGIGSYNDVNNFPIGQALIAVSHVRDEDLIRLKRDHPAEQVRLSSAGMESQVEQNLLVEKSHFFGNVRTYDRILLWMNAIGVSSYLATCSSSEADRSTDRQNDEDGSDIPKRDFTGLDCTAWVYDLFRPDEPYTARGTHPSGVGLDRYIRYSDLNSREQDFLRTQTYLSLLNFADPFLFGFEDLGGWNLKLSHYLTSFGYTLDANLFLHWQERQFVVRLHNGFNFKTYFPGVSVEWLDQRLSDKWSLTSSLTLWQQPKAARFNAVAGELLASVGTRFSYAWSEQLAPYIGFEAKTPGWMAGNVFLDRNVSIWTGFKLNVF